MGTLRSTFNRGDKVWIMNLRRDDAVIRTIESIIGFGFEYKVTSDEKGIAPSFLSEKDIFTSKMSALIGHKKELTKSITEKISILQDEIKHIESTFKNMHENK